MLTITFNHMWQYWIFIGALFMITISSWCDGQEAWENKKYGKFIFNSIMSIIFGLLLALFIALYVSQLQKI